MSSEGKWVWARRDTTWDPYPKEQPRVKLRMVDVGPRLVRLFHENGAETVEGYVVVRDVEPEAPSRLLDAIDAARGGPAPTKLKGYA